MKNDFAFLLVTYKNPKDTNRCIQSIVKQTAASSLAIEIFVYDNSPKLSKYDNKAKVFGTGVNTGFAASCNYLANVAGKSSKNLIFLNNDTILEPKFIKNLAKIKKDFDKNIALCPLIIDQKRSIWFSGAIIKNRICRPVTLQKNINRRVKSEFLTGCCIIISAKNWIKSGGFDENYFLYYEDVDWSIRAVKSLDLFVDPALKIMHYTHSSTGHGNGPTQTYFQTRNNLYLAQKMHQLKFNIVYMLLLSIKRCLNLVTKPSPQKWLTFKMLLTAWKDFFIKNYGKGSYFQK